MEKIIKIKFKLKTQKTRIFEYEKEEQSTESTNLLKKEEIVLEEDEEKENTLQIPKKSMSIIEILKQKYVFILLLIYTIRNKTLNCCFIYFF